MKLVDNVRSKMRSYSICTLILIGLTFWGPEQYYAVSGRDINPYHVGYVMLFLIVFGIIGWFIDQHRPSLWRTFKLALISLATTAVILLMLALPARAMAEVQVSNPVAIGLPTWAQTGPITVPITARWEGSGPTFRCSESPSGVCVRPYMDTIADPDVLTICYGETFNVSPRETRTIEQCHAGLSVGLERYWRGWRQGLTASTLHVKVDAAMTDLTWNIGIGAARGSSALAALNRGDPADACRRMTIWNKAGQHIVRGLVNRRQFGYVICMEGVV